MIDKLDNTFEPDNYSPTTVIGEFSGRDSVAAILKAFRDGVDYILPIATFAGTEYGDFNSIYENYVKLEKRVKDLYGDSKVIYPLIEYNREDLWHLINGRFTGELIRKYDFYNPCVGCHLYFHLTKLPFAQKLSKKIISGERESHDGRIKVNQLHLTLEAYKKILSDLGYELMMPLQFEKSGDSVSELIGWDWEEGKDHPKCVLSGNYRNIDGLAIYNGKKLEYFINDYLYNVGKIVGNHLLNGTEIKEVKQLLGESI